MRWFRGLGSRFGGWVALVAIALQLVLAFGHVHRDAFSHASEIAALTSNVADRGEPASPAPPHDHDYCAICAVMNLLAGAQGATAPALPVPAATEAAAVVAEPETIRTVDTGAAFQSRAPPLA